MLFYLIFSALFGLFAVSFLGAIGTGVYEALWLRKTEGEQAAQRRVTAARWRKRMVTAALWTGVASAGAILSMTSKRADSEALYQALSQIEKGELPDENQEWLAKIELMANASPVNIELGAYKSLLRFGNITYDVVLILRDNARYEVAMTVGNDRIHKKYTHAGRWWVEGQVFKTIMTEGDLFLAPPTARDRSTPMNEIIVSANSQELVLQAHMNPKPVKFERIKDVQINVQESKQEPQAPAVAEDQKSQAGESK